MENYRTPKQGRSIASEHRMLEAFLSELGRCGFSDTSLDVVANIAGVTRPGLLRRFGSKRAIVLVLYDRYCDKCIDGLSAFKRNLETYSGLEAFVTELYLETERAHRDNRTINLAMSQMFYSDLAPADGTKRVFKTFVDLFAHADAMGWGRFSKAGIFAATQVLISTSLNSVLGAMGGLPQDQALRAALATHLIIEALQFDYGNSRGKPQNTA